MASPDPSPRSLRTATHDAIEAMATASPCIVVLQDCDVRGVDFSLFDLSNAHCMFDGGRFEACSFRGCVIMDLHLSDAELLRCDFAGLDSRCASFVGATITECSFRGARLVNALFVEATLKDCEWDGANLNGATFDKVRGSRPPLSPHDSPPPR